MGKKPETFAARLRLLREVAGLTVQQLAEAAGMNRQVVYQLEADRCRPMLETAAKLAKALGVSLDDLAGKP